jgi:deoxyribodipyrimidine photo-lyase
MSNRGRQIAASCLVNEMGVDWRFGAAFFEKHLLDYDVASNYANWQYIAGVGADPRGGRHFDLEKQTALYDPDGVFIGRWGGKRPKQPKHVVDAADWPIEAPTAPLP